MLLAFCYATAVFAQQARSISGKVASETGEGLPGVSILAKGTTSGTATDNDGKYTLQVPDGATTLVVSFIGYVTEEVAIGNQTTLNISLVPDIKALGEVVVVGYGKQKRENVVGSVSQVSANQLQNRPVTQLSNALSGQMPGVTVAQRTGKPGANASVINVRGVGSFGATAGALVLIDGIPGNMNDIDPNDVASISVLKDASSAAIYGARAANGVILVTTKMGKEGKVTISYNGYTGFQKPTVFPDFLPSWEYAAMYNEAIGSEVYTPEDIEKFRNGSSPDTHPNTDFMGAVFSKNGLQTGHNVSISGGTATNEYNLSLGYLFQDGLVVKNNADRYNIRLNLKTALGPKLDLTTRLSGIKTSDDEPAGPATGPVDLLRIVNQAIRTPSIYPGVLSNGDYGTGLGQNGTPISFLESESFIRNAGSNLLTNLQLDYRVINDLRLSLIAGYNQTTVKNKTFLATQRINTNITLGPNELTVNNTQTDYYTVQGLAEYTKQFGKHQIGILGGYSFEANTFESVTAFRNNLPGNALTQLNVGALDNQQASGTANEWAIESLFGRINYSFANKYLVEAVARRDGSSRFPTSRKYAFFPSAAVGYRLGQENFIRNNVDWIDELKLKASVGVLGNQNIGNYDYQNTLSLGSVYNYSFGGIISSGAARTVIVDPTLHWESTRTTDVGVEVGLFKGLLNASATYFDRYTYDILVSPGGSVSSTLGFGVGRQNSGKLSNTGWEFTLSHTKTIDGFSYNINGNFSVIKNKVLDLGVGNVIQPNGKVGNGSSLFIGYPIQMYFGYVADGLYVDQADIDSYQLGNESKSIQPNPKPGDVRYRDISGPDGVPDGKVDATYDRTFLGSSIPKYTFGLTIGASFKGFDATLLLQGIAGVQNNQTEHVGYAFWNTGSIQRWQMEERWTSENPRADAEYPRLEILSTNGSPNTLLSSFWVINGAYLRGKNVQIGYTIPKTWSQKIGVPGIRLYASGDNLFTISNYRKGWDPEAGSSGGNATRYIANGLYYPLLRIYTFGVNVKF